MKLDIRQADNSRFLGVNHPWGTSRSSSEINVIDQRFKGQVHWDKKHLTLHFNQWDGQWDTDFHSAKRDLQEYDCVNYDVSIIDVSRIIEKFNVKVC